MATDQATADYEYEQERREVLQDNEADWVEFESALPESQTIPTLCTQCIQWQPASLADSTTSAMTGCCAVRSATKLPQQSQTYAERCRFYEEDIPF
jgi:hypothetical protein